MWFKLFALFSLCFYVATGSTSVSVSTDVSSEAGKLPFLEHTSAKSRFVGGVYVMTNDFEKNSVLAYGRLRNGKLKLLGEYKTGGRGAALDDGNGVDPLISAFSLIITVNRRYVVAVNAGSSSMSVFRILPNFKLHLTDIQRVQGKGPVSIAYSGDLFYAASSDRDGQFNTPFAQKGVLSGFRLSSRTGKFSPISHSVRQLTNRPAAVKFSPDGRSLIVSSVFAGAADLNTDTVKQLVSYRVNRRTGRLSSRAVSAVTSTELNNRKGRNLPTTIGFEIVSVRNVQYVIATEARGLGPDGVPGAPPQTPSISTWRLNRSGRLFPVQLDVLVGSSVTNGQMASCWLEFSTDFRYFWVANTGSDTLSAFRFSGGRSTLVKEVAAKGANPVDLWRSDDGKYVYQLFSGSVGAFKIINRFELKQIQSETSVPDMNAQGIVAF